MISIITEYCIKSRAVFSGEIVYIDQQMMHIQKLEVIPLRRKGAFYGGCKLHELPMDSIPGAGIWENVCCFSSSSLFGQNTSVQILVHVVQSQQLLRLSSNSN